MRRHSVLVAYPISEKAQARLQTFFDLEFRVEIRKPSRGEQIALLRDKAGVIGDGKLVFDAELVEQLPTLKAVCTMENAHDHLDLPALTRAGIRATQVPDPKEMQHNAMRFLEPAWEWILASARAASTDCGPASGRYVNRWSRRLTLGLARNRVHLSLAGSGALAQLLVSRAHQVGMHVHQVSLPSNAAGPQDTLPAWQQADVVVVLPDIHAPVQITRQFLAKLKPTAKVLNLTGLSAIAQDLYREPLWLERIDSSLCLAQAPHAGIPEHQWNDRSWVAADELIASLGFGRNSWHPRYLLNTDIACESCC